MDALVKLFSNLPWQSDESSTDTDKKKLPELVIEPVKFEEIETRFKAYRESFAQSLKHMAVSGEKTINLITLGVLLTKLEYLFEQVNILRTQVDGQPSLPHDAALLIQQYLIFANKSLYAEFLRDAFLHPLSQIHQDLKRFIFDKVKESLQGKEEERCFYQVGNPNLVMLKDSIQSDPLKNFPPEKILFSDDGTEFMIIPDILYFWVSSDEHMKPFRYSNDGRIISLTAHEIKRLKEHSAQVKDYCESIERLKNKKTSSSVAGEMRKLIAHLRAYREGYNGSTSFQVDHGVYKFINEFKLFLSLFPEEIQDKILNSQTSNGTEFRSMWNRLGISSVGKSPQKSPFKKQKSHQNSGLKDEAIAHLVSQEVEKKRYCVINIADTIESIVNNNPWLDDCYLINEKANNVIDETPFLEIHADLTEKQTICENCFSGKQQFTPCIDSERTLEVQLEGIPVQTEIHEVLSEHEHLKESYLKYFPTKEIFLNAFELLSEKDKTYLLTDLNLILQTVSPQLDLSDIFKLLDRVPLENRYAIIQQNSVFFIQDVAYLAHQTLPNLDFQLSVIGPVHALEYINTHIKSISFDNNAFKDLVIKIQTLPLLDSQKTDLTTSLLGKIPPDALRDYITQCTEDDYLKISKFFNEDALLALFNQGVVEIPTFDKVIEVFFNNDWRKAYYFFPEHTRNHILNNFAYKNLLFQFLDHLTEEECVRFFVETHSKIKGNDVFAFTHFLESLAASINSLADGSLPIIPKPLTDTLITITIEYLESLDNDASKHTLCLALLSTLSKGMMTDNPRYSSFDPEKLALLTKHLGLALSSKITNPLEIPPAVMPLLRTFLLFLHKTYDNIPYSLKNELGDIRLLDALAQSLKNNPEIIDENLAKIFIQLSTLFPSCADRVRIIDGFYHSAPNLYTQHSQERRYIQDLGLTTNQNAMIVDLHAHPFDTSIGTLTQKHNIVLSQKESPLFLNAFLSEILLKQSEKSERVANNPYLDALPNGDLVFKPSAMELVLSSKMQDIIYKNFPAFLAKIDNTEQKKNILANMISFYIHSREIRPTYLRGGTGTLSQWANTKLSYSKEQKSAAAKNLLSAVISSESIDPAHEKALRNKHLGFIYQAYREMSQPQSQPKKGLFSWRR